MRCTVFFPPWVGVHFAFPLRCVSGLMWFFIPDTSPFQQMLVFPPVFSKFFETPNILFDFLYASLFLFPTGEGKLRPTPAACEEGRIQRWKSSVCARAFRSELLHCNKGVRSDAETRRNCRKQPGKLWMTFWLPVVEQCWLCTAFSMFHSLTGYSFAPKS